MYIFTGNLGNLIEEDGVNNVCNDNAHSFFDVDTIFHLTHVASWLVY